MPAKTDKASEKFVTLGQLGENLEKVPSMKKIIAEEREKLARKEHKASSRNGK